MNPTHLSSETLDRLVLGALSDSARAEADAHLKSCPRCQGDFSQLEADTQHFRQYVLPRTQDAVRARVRGRPGWRRFAVPFLALAGAGTLALVLLPRAAVHVPGPYRGVKGGPLLQVYDLRAGAQRPVPLPERARVSAGDRLRFVVQPAGYRYLLVVSVDGQGTASAYFPPEGAASAALKPGKQKLPGAIELDAAPGTEHLYAYFSQSPLALHKLVPALKAHPGEPPLPRGAAPPLVFTLQKAPP